jgi:Protein of unknown function (DUF3311)
LRKLLLLVPVIAALAVPVYNVTETRFFGFPYFWWFQLGLIPVSALFILAVYLGDRK